MSNTFAQLFGMGCENATEPGITITNSGIHFSSGLTPDESSIKLHPVPYKMSDNFVQRIIVNGDATIVFWVDDTKTVVQRSKDTEYSLYNAFTAALAIKLFGSNSKVQKIIETKKVVQSTKHGPVKHRAIFKLGDRVVLANPDKEDDATKALFADNNLVVDPATPDGKVTVLAGHMDGLKRFDIEQKRLALYDRT